MNSNKNVKIGLTAGPDDDGNNGDNKTNDTGLDVRHTYISLVSKKFGTLTTGPPSTAGRQQPGPVRHGSCPARELTDDWIAFEIQEFQW